ncbi:MAG: hypothetical protein EOP20_09230, partial [Hyphomicrobiales bacterium]
MKTTIALIAAASIAAVATPAAAQDKAPFSGFRVGAEAGYDMLRSGSSQDVDNTRDKRLPTTIMHWHPHAVAALAFTPSGAQLLSVGQESVLVQWEVSSGKHEFFPRLGGRPIISLAIKPASRG